MLPLLAIGTAISAVSAVVSGVTWLSKQLADTKDAEAPDPKGAKKSGAAEQGDFAAALSAQTAGQSAPQCVISPLPQISQATPSVPSIGLSPSSLASSSLASSSSASNGLASIHAITADAAHLAEPDVSARLKVAHAAYKHHGQHHEPSEKGLQAPSAA